MLKSGLLDPPSEGSGGVPESAIMEEWTMLTRGGNRRSEVRCDVNHQSRF